ncbi:MAG TPA: hypothetical protein VG841_07440 [Caulobacterales bacterium]|nr:hypothetical protein [Caulobacterales bacterium]
MSEPAKKHRRGALAGWLFVCAIAAGAAMALDVAAARPAPWIAASPLGRAAIGAGAAIGVVLAAWLMRLALARRAMQRGEGA